MKRATLALISTMVFGFAPTLFPSSPLNAETPAATTLPVVVCPTIHGSDWEPRTIPTTRASNVPADLSRRFSVYSDDQDEVSLLAPRGWTCQASIGADGNDYLWAYPRGEVRSRLTRVYKWPNAAQAVTADLLPVCEGCVLEQACPFFPKAEQDLVVSYGTGFHCPHRPPGQDVERVTSTAVAFADPPGKKGTGNPSGGEYPADGVVTFKEQSGTNIYGSSMETCTLPLKDQAICVVVRNVFIALWDKNASLAPGALSNQRAHAS